MTSSASSKCVRCGEQLTLVNGGTDRLRRCESCGVSYRVKTDLEGQQGEVRPQNAQVASRSSSKPVQKLARFELKRLLGKGGFGKVFLAYDPRLEREVAIKVPTFSIRDQRRVARFRLEARTASILRHPNIVQTFESGESQGTLYIVSQYVQGKSLKDYLGDKSLGFVQTSIWVESIARALHYAHHSGVVHRDIKPDNILIDQSSEPQVMDFGLAKREGRKGVTQEGAILGTVSYMSPEQARGDDDDVSATSDQYSLGAILYEMLCGSRSYDGAAHVVLTKVADPLTNPESPRTRRPSIPRDLEVICLKAMANQIDERYQNCEDFADDLRRWRNDQSIIARRSSLFEKTYRFGRRNPLVSLLTVSLAIAFAISLGYHIKNVRLGKSNDALAKSNDALVGGNEKLQIEKDRLDEEIGELTSQVKSEDLKAKAAMKRAATEIAEAEIALENAVTKRKAKEQLLNLTTEELRGTQVDLEKAKTNLKLVRYQSQIQRASQSLVAKNYPKARAELRKCDQEMLAWEWRYLQAKSMNQIWSRRFNRNVIGHLCLNQGEGDRGPSVALLTDNGLEIVDAETGETQPNGTLLADLSRPLRVTTPGFLPIPPSVRWSPLKADPKGRFLALTTREDDERHRVRIFDLKTGQQVPSNESYQEIVFFESASLLAINASGAFESVNTDTWDLTRIPDRPIEQMRHLLVRHNAPDFIEFPGVGQNRNLDRIKLKSKFCVKRNESQARFRDIDGCKYVELSGDRKSVMVIVLRETGSRLIVISNNNEGTITKFDVEMKIGEPKPGGRYCLSNDGRYVAAILSGKAHLFDASTGNRIAVMGPANDIGFVESKDQREALLTINEDRVDLFALDPLDEVLPPRQPFRSVAFSDQYLVGLDQEHYLWTGAKQKDGRYRELPRSMIGLEKRLLTAISYSADSQALIAHSRTAAFSLSPNGVSQLWKVVLTGRDGHFRTPVRSLRVSPGGKEFATIDENGMPIAWRPDDKSYRPTAMPSDSIDFHPQGDAVWIDEQRILSTTARQKKAVAGPANCPVWNTRTGQIESWISLEGLVLEIDAKQSRLAVGSENGSVEVYRLIDEGAAIRLAEDAATETLLFDGPVSSIKFFPDSNRLVAAGDQQLKIIETMTGSELFSMDSRIGEIRDLVISKNGATIAAVGNEPGIWVLDSVGR